MDAYIKRILFTLLFSIFTISSAQAIQLENNFRSSDVNLTLNGQGVRDKFFIDLYVGSLYLKNKSSNDELILQADKPMNIRLHIISSLITSEKMENSTREGFVKSTNDNIEPLKDKIEIFIKVFREKIIQNDIYDFLYIPNIGTKIYKNNKFITIITGKDFKKALFGIWLSKNPVQNSLKEDMLGI